ncbi:MAG: exodeoxyribonuclease VII large subunit [Candidatus Marinimicrobia bacterium]|jgi:exodeoxyribonuclease VII large subunit|nr:exodeoxyribonuclease VII large subunit [Candidatus Neomarinimicrobiota bacterium]MBT3632241.1 exodeoxyribonuclease VII large subunit [Candidatus Neomarinimicrobiota bacterium]MBT3825951.1 exodeoxyribonuclease VII large subunit [Candidatus Neomarinimicrobiota bacterium]MBT4129643.1 exodeoxyribonuclease VII large subunit [Candidatus Neomarinimicrobiota bacterium]MBT4294462.1 exodeoxyribonuclease VII large subunit [Candidatus Neomarinimicrobiota bacterium]
MAQSAELSNTFSVSQITGHIQHTLEKGFASVWVKGEISNLTRHSSGHWYFSLKDSGAQLGSVMFRRQNEGVRFEPTHGMEITAHGRISVYPPQGRYQLVVDQMLPAGQGDLHLAFENLKKKLHAEGLFDPSRKQKLPAYPTKIGIVTSPTGAAIRDMINILSRRFPLAELILLPVKVQGDGAAAEIAKAIDSLNNMQECQVLLVGRGGGSLEDLWAFNEEVVARAIADSKIPVVSAVGHETDTTISDFVADHRAPTPSAAAELVVPDQVELTRWFMQVEQSLHSNIRGRIERYDQRLDAIARSYALKRPALMIEQFMQKLDQFEDRSIRSTQEKIAIVTARLDNLSVSVVALNPLNILDKGYAVISGAEGSVIRSIDEISDGSELHLRMKDGEISSIASAVKKRKIK